MTQRETHPTAEASLGDGVVTHGATSFVDSSAAAQVPRSTESHRSMGPWAEHRSDRGQSRRE